MSNEGDAFERPAARRAPPAVVVLAALVSVALAGALLRGLTGLDADPPGELTVDEDDGPPPEEPGFADEEPPEPPQPEPDDEPAAADGADLDDAGGSWSDLADAPLAPRATAPAWTGQELVVWGGQQETFLRRPFFDDGAAYDPAADQWRELPPAPLGPRGGHVTVWADDRVLVWGGQDRVRYHNDGAAYDPQRDAWRRIPPAPISPRRNAVAGWVGGELVVAGGHDGGGPVTDAAAYDPVADEWRSLEGEIHESAGPGFAQSAVLGDRLVVLSPDFSNPAQGGLQVYDPDAGRWESLAAPATFAASGAAQWIAATDDLLVAVSAQGPGGRPRMAVHDEDGWRQVDHARGSRGAPQLSMNPQSRAVAADGDRVFVIDDAREPLQYHLADESWAALPEIVGLALDTEQGYPMHYQAVAVGEGVAVWVGGAAEAQAPDTAHAHPAGVVVWRPGEGG